MPIAAETSWISAAMAPIPVLPLEPEPEVEQHPQERDQHRPDAVDDQLLAHPGAHELGALVAEAAPSASSSAALIHSTVCNCACWSPSAARARIITWSSLPAVCNETSPRSSSPKVERVSARSAGPGVRTSSRTPPRKSTPRLSPWSRPGRPWRPARTATSRRPAVAEERDLRVVGDEAGLAHGPSIALQSGRAARQTVVPDADQEPAEVHGREHVGDDTKAQRHGEALDRAEAELEQRQGRDQRGEFASTMVRMASPKPALIAERGSGALSAPRGRARRSGRWNRPPGRSSARSRRSRQREGGAEQRHDPEDQDHVEHQRDVGDQPNTP